MYPKFWKPAGFFNAEQAGAKLTVKLSAQLIVFWYKKREGCIPSL